MAEVFLGKGYNVSDGYMGYDPETKDYRLFASEADYRDTIIFPQMDSEEDKEGL